MMILFRRWLVLAVLAFWQGGFTFYASVVVPVGQAQLGHMRQGFITRHVTEYLNLSGGLALTVLAWDVVATADVSLVRQRLRWATWAGMVAALLVLLWLHGQLMELLDLDDRLVTDPAAFRLLHRTYLWISTVQWGLALGYAALSLRAWQREDGVAEAVPSLSAASSARHSSCQPMGRD